MPDRVIKRHDTAVQPRVKLLDEAGTAINLTGATVTYTLRNTSSGVLKINGGATTLANQGTNPGEVYYQFAAGDVDMIGTYEEQWQVTYSGGAKETFPVGAVQYVKIEEDYDNV